MLSKKSEINYDKTLVLTGFLERELYTDEGLLNFIFSHSVRLFFNHSLIFLFFFFASFKKKVESKYKI